jgi:hypothetical protein
LKRLPHSLAVACAAAAIALAATNAVRGADTLVRPELRAVGALNNLKLITALISFNCQLGLVGLQLRILKGVGFAAHYPGRKQGVGRLCERAEWRARKSSNDNGDP